MSLTFGIIDSKCAHIYDRRIKFIIWNLDNLEQDYRDWKLKDADYLHQQN